jgi:predicted dehydrogenase
MWVGPARWLPYNVKHTHGAFRWMIDFGGGQIRDRGAHVMSIANWIMDADYTGPVSVEAKGEPPHDGMYDSAVSMEVTYEFRSSAIRTGHWCGRSQACLRPSSTRATALCTGATAAISP